MKRFISALIVAVMLFCAFPLTLVAAAETTYTPIALGVETPVSVSKTDVERDFTFTAPKDGTYAFYSMGECDTYGYVFDVSDGSLIAFNDDYYDSNFLVEFDLLKGEKINLKTTMYDFMDLGEYKVIVNERGAATGIVPEENTMNVYVGTNFEIYYNVVPISAYNESAELLPADTTIVSESGGSLYAEKLGTTTVKIKSENGLEASVTVNVIAPKKLELNKTATASGDRYYRFTFTPAEDGCYTFFPEFTSGGYIGIDGVPEVPSSDGRTYKLTKGVEYLIYVESYSESDINLTVKKAVAAEDIYVVAYSDMTFIGHSISIYAEPINGAFIDSVQWNVSDDELAEIYPSEYSSNEITAYLIKKGEVTITATSGDVSNSITVDITEIPVITLETPYSKKTVSYENIYAKFVAPKDGYYRLSAEDSLGYYAATGVYGEFESLEYCDFYAPAGQSYTVFACRDEYNETEEEGTITIKVQEIPKAVSATPVKTTIDAVVDQEVNLLLNTQPAVCHFDGVAEWASDNSDCDIYTDFNGTGYFIARSAGTYNLTFYADGISAKVTVNVTEPASVPLGQEKTQTVKPEHASYIYTFTPEKSGLYTAEVLSGNVEIVISNDMLGFGRSGNTNSLIGGIEYTVRVLCGAENEAFSFKLRNSEFATEIRPVYKYIFATVGDYVWTPLYTVDGDNEEYIKSINIADTKIAVSEDGFIVAKAAGETEVEIVTESGLKTKCVLIVFAKDYVGVGDIVLDKEELTLDIGKSEVLTASTVPETESKIYWFSEDESVATVDQNGRVTAIREGETFIVAAADGIYTACAVTTKAPAIVDSSKVFTDIKAGKWYSDAVDYAYSYGFIAGVSKTEFGLSQPVTRGMFITILARIAGVDTSTAANKKATTKFTDVKTGKFYTAAIKWASENGVVSGLTDTTFGPDVSIERQQLCVMIVNFAKYMGVELEATKSAITFKDSNKFAKYAKNAIAICQKANIISGYAVSGGYEFRPTNTATRGEAAQILYKFHKDFVMK